MQRRQQQLKEGTLHLELAFSRKYFAEVPSAVRRLQLGGQQRNGTFSLAIKQGLRVRTLLLRSSPCSRSSRLT